MIDHYDVGVFGLVALLEEETIAKMRAKFADAVVGIGIELFPFIAVGHEGQFRAIAGPRASAPIPETLHRTRRRDQPIGTCAFELLLAQIVAAAFEQRY